jgi:hypothetical protein
MDSTSILLIAVPLVLGVVLSAVRFMRFIGFLTGARRRTSGGAYGESLLSFDERLAERLRELERGNSTADAGPAARQATPGFGRRQG